MMKRVLTKNGVKTMDQAPARFDMKRPPVRTKRYLRPITWALSAPAVLRHRTVICKTGMEGVKPP